MTAEQLGQRFELAGGGVADTLFLDDLLRVYDEDQSNLQCIFEDYSVADILTYLQATHAYYLKKRIPEIERTLQQLILVAQPGMDVAREICRFYTDYVEEFKEHVWVEEELLFPYVKDLIHGRKDALFSIAYFETLHTDDIEIGMVDFIPKLQQMEPGLGSYLSFRVLDNLIREFYKDLVVHGKIENDVLIPRAKELEA